MTTQKDLYNSLGLRIISDKEFYNIQETLSDFYNIHNFSYFNPNIELFTNYPKAEYTLNNNNKLLKLIKKGGRKSVSGFFYKALLKNKSNRHFYKNVFIKEIPIFTPLNIKYYYNNCNQSVTSINNDNHIISSILYNLNEQCNVEIFVNYLVSKLKELMISPHFCEYYGSYNVNMNKFTYDITDDDPVINSIDKITEDDSIPLRVIDKNGLYLEYKELPCYLLVTEKLTEDISYIEENELLTYEIVLSFTFQIFSAIITMNTLFGLKHNDLHFGNIMIKKTDKQFLYYSIGNTYYKIPTYGFIICIFDWGRATYNFNNYIGKNNIFTSSRDCFNQYIYQKINNKGYNTIKLDKNIWTDIVMVSHSILHEFKSVLKDTPLEEILLDNITTPDRDQLDIDLFDWDLYLNITCNKFNIKPKELITNQIYNKFKIKKKLTKTKHIYNIYLI
jgi:hypothetical protein